MTTAAPAALTPIDPERRAIVKAAMAKVVSGEIDIADVIDTLSRPPAELETSARKPVKVKPLAPAQVDALAQIDALHLQVTQVAASAQQPRELTEAERKTLHEARVAADALAALAKHLKDEAVRELVATHLDKQAERTGTARPGETPMDDRGHYLVAAETSIPGTEQVFRREMRTSRPVISSERLLAAYESGALTREQYLALTREARVFDPARAAQAILRDPDLAFLLAEHAADQKAPTASINVRKG